MADDSGYKQDTAEALKRIAAAVEGINNKLERVVQKRHHQGMSGPNADYWVLVVEPHDYTTK